MTKLRGRITRSPTTRNAIVFNQGSALVKVGQTVKQGDVVGAIGASGSSLFPHLHYELRDGSGAKPLKDYLLIFQISAACSVRVLLTLKKAR